MALDRRKGLQNAERLLKQGKVQAALSELERVSEGAPDDLLTLNRLGDLLARQGRAAEAVAYYRKIADQFAQGGFFPKAAAIHKKILRLDPQNTESLVQLGHLYIEQRLNGEARNYLLHAANHHVQARQFDRAEAIYLKLADAEPDDLRHRVRLAETRAALGKVAEAARELIALGERLLASGDGAEAEKLFARAVQLAPQSEDALVGHARCLTSLGRASEGLAMLEAAADGAEVSPRLAGELAIGLCEAGRAAEIVRALDKTEPMAIEPALWRRLFEAAERQDEHRTLWSQLERWLAQPSAGNGQAGSSVLEALSTMEGEIGLSAARRLRELAPEPPVRPAAKPAEPVRKAGPPPPKPVAAASKTALRPPVGTAGAPRGSEGLPPEIEAPAVPLNRADQEFAAGRLTQAEVLEKYGLPSQALEQVDAVTQRFPGHVAAQQARVELLRPAGGAPLAEALAGLAIAQRAAGDLEPAVDSALAAMNTGKLPARSQSQLEQAGLLAPVASGSRPARSATASPARTEAKAPLPPSKRELVLDLDGDAAGEAGETPAPRTAGATRPSAAGPKRAPSADMLAEIERLLKDGSVEDVSKRVASLRALGYAGEELDGIEARLAGSQAAPETTSAATAKEPVAPESDLVIDELSEIAAALEEELFADGEPLVRDDGPQESVDEIFAAFKQRVREHVSSEDYRMHYDLGIGFKSMGLIDEAISAFEQAVPSPELAQEACTMIAVCHHERGDAALAAQWYRRAIAEGKGSAEVISRLRYDLAEVLLEAGDARGALDQFRDVMQSDPSYRDVEGRIRTLESNLGS